MKHLDFDLLIFGTRGSEVQILSPRPIVFIYLQLAAGALTRAPGCVQVVSLKEPQKRWLSRGGRLRAPLQNHLQMKGANVFDGLVSTRELLRTTAS